MTKTYIDELAEEIAKLREENRQLRKWCEEFNALNVAQENRRLKKVERKKSKLVNENYKLKKLLKECRDVIEWYKADCGYKDVPTESVLTKIDEALK